MSDFRQLSDHVLASPQIALADLVEAKALGVTDVICNRPDGEEAGQLAAGDVEAAATELGLGFTWIPVTGTGFSQPQVEAMRTALDGAAGKVLAYCRSGTRSTLLWSLAESAKGIDPTQTAAVAAAAGYDVTPVRPAMDMLAGTAPE